MTNIERWRGLRALVSDAVEQGASAIERVHLETARRPFVVLEHIPGVRGPARIVHQAHDDIVSSVYAAIRTTNQLVGKTMHAALDVLDSEAGESSRPSEGANEESR